MEVVPLTRNREGIAKARVLIDPKFDPMKLSTPVTVPRVGVPHVDANNSVDDAAA